MVELVDMQDLGSCGAIRKGSSPFTRTKRNPLEGAAQAACSRGFLCLEGKSAAAPCQTGAFCRKVHVGHLEKMHYFVKIA